MVVLPQGVLAFRRNDPLHFGSLPAALWTSVSMCSLDVRARQCVRTALCTLSLWCIEGPDRVTSDFMQAWNDVFYINFYGCDSVPSAYQLYAGTTETFILR